MPPLTKPSPDLDAALSKWLDHDMPLRLHEGYLTTQKEKPLVHYPLAASLARGAGRDLLGIEAATPVVLNNVLLPSSETPRADGTTEKTSGSCDILLASTRQLAVVEVKRQPSRRDLEEAVRELIKYARIIEAVCEERVWLFNVFERTYGGRHREWAASHGKTWTFDPYVERRLGLRAWETPSWQRRLGAAVKAGEAFAVIASDSDEPVPDELLVELARETGWRVAQVVVRVPVEGVGVARAQRVALGA